jgi:predicted Fe-Mo cluster-binding NifX family protein
MSKLSTRIRRTTRSEPAPLGFGLHQVKAESATMLIAVRTEASKVADAAKAGADIVIIEGSPGKLKDTGDLIVGANAGSADRAAAEKLRESGVDFLVVDLAGTNAEAMLDEKLGFAVQLGGADLDDVRLRVVGDLGLDAIILPAPEPPVTLERLIEFRRIAGLVRAPVLVEVDPGIDVALLQVLRDSGTAGVIVPAGRKLNDLKDRIASLPPRGRRREQEKDTALVPSAGHGHDEDDDYDDD